MEREMNIGWYPGHMAKTKRELNESIKLVDIVIELLDARIPAASRNPDIDALARNKKRIVVLHKAELADAQMNKKWEARFNELGFTVIITDSVIGYGIKEITAAGMALMEEKMSRHRERGRIFTPCRAMIAGIPNVGKSTLINKFSGRSAMKTGAKPGVTRARQWIKIKNGFELLDTPGILWPKLDDEAAGIKLALTGAIKDDILDKLTLSLKLIEMIVRIKPAALHDRYGAAFTEEMSAPEILERIGRARHFILKGGETDLMRTGITLIDEFRAAKISRITLESP